MIKLKDILLEIYNLRESRDLFSKVESIPLDIVGDDSDIQQEDRSKFLNAPSKGLTPDDVTSTLSQLEKEPFTRGVKGRLPYIHKKKILAIKNEAGGTYDLNKLKNIITTRPKELLGKNEKMKHSNDLNIQFFDLGIPAAKALVYNEKKEEFTLVNTCPGMGTCTINCFAMKGGFVIFINSAVYLTKVINFLLNDPDGFEAKLTREISNKIKNQGKKGIDVRIRWHDAGDFFSPAYLELAFDIARKFPQVKFYAYTKLSSVAHSEKPSNFLTRFSTGAKRSEQNKIELNKDYAAEIVPSELWNDLVVPAKNGRPRKDKKGRCLFKSSSSENELKNRIYQTYKDEYGIKSKKYLLSCPEYLENYNKLRKEKLYHVILVPGDSDLPASEENVAAVYNLEH